MATRIDIRADEVTGGGATAIVERGSAPQRRQAVRHAVSPRRTGMSSRWKTSGLSGSRRARRRFSAFAMGGEMGQNPSDQRLRAPWREPETPPASSIS